MLPVYMTLLGVLLLGVGAIMGGWQGKVVSFLGLVAVLIPAILGGCGCPR